MHLFIPCFMDQFAPQVGEAVVRLLERLGVAWSYPADQTCCGQFALTMGDVATARRLMRHFFQVFHGAPALVCPSASCTWMVRHHYPALAETAGERRIAASLAARTWELSEWLGHLGAGLPWRHGFPGTLVLQNSCKARQLGALPGAARLLSQVEGLDLREVSPYYSCCGFGGVFSWQHPDLGRDIGLAYLEAVQEAGATGLVSLDYGCLLHLQGVARASGLGMRFFHLAELLVQE